MPSKAFAFGLAVFLTLAAASCATSGPSPVAREWYDLGNAWLDKGDWKKAGAAYSRALALDPSFAGASFNFARALTESGNYDEALQVLGELGQRDPTNVRIISAKAYALYKKGDAKAALVAYRQVLALDAFAPDAVYNVALLELASGDASAAVADLERLTAAKSDDGQAFLLLGQAIDRRAELAAKEAEKTGVAGADEKAAATKAADDSALAAYEQARTLGKADSAALRRIADIYKGEKRYPEAMDALEAALKADPKNAAAAFSLARLRLVVAQDSEKGLAALKAALDAGFADKDAAAALLAEPDLPSRQKVFDLLKAKDLAE